MCVCCGHADVHRIINAQMAEACLSHELINSIVNVWVWVFVNVHLPLCFGISNLTCCLSHRAGGGGELMGHKVCDCLISISSLLQRWSTWAA